MGVAAIASFTEFVSNLKIHGKSADHILTFTVVIKSKQG